MGRLDEAHVDAVRLVDIVDGYGGHPRADRARRGGAHRHHYEPSEVGGLLSAREAELTALLEAWRLGATPAASCS